MAEKRTTYKLQDVGGIGEVKIADNEVLKQAVEVYAQLVNEGYMTEYTDWDQYIASMNNGDAAGVINGCWIMSSVQKIRLVNGQL